MNSLVLSLQATGAATQALLSLRRYPTGAPYLQESVRILCRAVRNLNVHLEKPPVRTQRVPPPLVVPLPPIPDPAPMRVDHPLAAQEVNGCKALLLEIIRRAAYDWVLYRTSERLPQKKLAQDAYLWLFFEEPGHQNWIERQMSQKGITSFLSICEMLDLDPGAVRVQIRKLTVKNVMSVGRPAEYRRNEYREEERCISSEVALAFQQYEDELLYCE